MKITRNRGLPPISNIESFIKVVELGSVSAAADDLSLTQSAVSRHVIDFERFINKSLLTRGATGLVINDEAKQLAAKLSLVLGDLNSLLSGVESGNSEKTIRISAPPIFCIHLFSKYCDQIQSLFGANVEITSKLGTPDLIEDDIDIAIINTPTSPANYVGELLMTTEYFPYVSRKLLGNRSPDSLDVFLTENLIDQRSLNDAWTVYFREKGIGRPPGIRTTFSIIDAALAAVVNNQGLAFIPEFAAKDFVANGTIIRLGATSYQSARSRYYLVASRSFSADPRYAQFHEWLKVIMTKTQA